MTAMQHRAVFDFEIRFSNGGDLQGRDFRLDIPSDAVGHGELARRIVDDMRLLMVDTVDIRRVRIVREAHKRGAIPAD